MPRKLPSGPVLLAVAAAVLLAYALANDDTQHNTEPVDSAWLIVIEESSERSPDMAMAVAATDFWQSLAGRRIQYRIYDQNQEAAEQYRQTATRVGLPAMILTDGDGKELLATKLPATVDDIDKALTKATGL